MQTRVCSALCSDCALQCYQLRVFTHGQHEYAMWACKQVGILPNIIGEYGPDCRRLIFTRDNAYVDAHGNYRKAFSVMFCPSCCKHAIAVDDQPHVWEDGHIVPIHERLAFGVHDVIGKDKLYGGDVVAVKDSQKPASLLFCCVGIVSHRGDADSQV
jgi:hypothetical protein